MDIQDEEGDCEKNAVNLNFLIFSLLFSICGIARCQDATLAYYLQRSELVLVATLNDRIAGGAVSGPIATRDHPVLETMSSIVTIKPDEVIKGSASTTQAFPIEICFLIVEREMHPLGKGPLPWGNEPLQDAPYGYRQGQKYIFFLRSYPPGDKTWTGSTLILWQTADPWFGVLPYTEALALALRRQMARP